MEKTFIVISKKSNTSKIIYAIDKHAAKNKALQLIWVGHPHKLKDFKVKLA